MMEFSFANRPLFIDRLKNEKFDLIIIGGGITGAGIALDAASRGLKTALIEKNDFAYGTSSRSTKLIHGGLRYLKQLEFGLVKEVGSERAIVHRLAPHLVIPEKMLLPLYEKRGLGSVLTSLGLKLYDWLAGVRPEDQRQMLTRNRTLQQEPLIKPDGIKGGAIYSEYRTDDARLTIEIIKTAVWHGATAVNYCNVTAFTYSGTTLNGVLVKDELKNAQFNITGTVIVNASGPWVDDLRLVDNSRKGKRLQLTKGVHVVVPFDKLPVKQAIYFDVEEDSRMIFAIPRGRTTYIGTTDTNYAGDKDKVQATREDAAYLLRAVNNTFQNVPLTLQDIESSWAGLRPLIHEEGKSAGELSRKDEIFIAPSGLISIAGGKLTGYRKMAERVTDLVIDKYFSDINLKECGTDQIRLTQNYFANVSAVQEFTEALRQNLFEWGLDSSRAEYLVSTYGSASGDIAADARKLKENKSAHPLVESELCYTIKHEMVCKLQDFFVRRTGMLYFESGLVMVILGLLEDLFKQQLNMSDHEFELELIELNKLINNLKHF